jgi:hypothetical protein
MPDPKAAKADDLTKLKRDDLDKAAAAAGVPNPDDLPNKDAVVEAIEAPNPALAPVPEPDEGEVSYQVIGPCRVHGHAPGETFTADLKPEAEALLIESGHIKRTTPED